MAGVVPVSLKKPSRRKQWTYHDGPRSSLRLLQGQLAEDGCPEAQVALAKQLLNETENVEDKEENARLAVYWLIKASEQGHMDATEILQHCLATGQGISEQNFLDVQKCLKMSQDEKLARRAARQLFNSLSAGQDYITTDQLRRRITIMKRDGFEPQQLQAAEHPVAGCSQDGSNDWMSRVGQSYPGEKLTEDCLVSAATTYTRGELPLVQRVLVLADPERGQLEQIGFIQRSVLHPLGTVTLVYTYLLEFFASQASFLLRFIIPSSPFKMLVVLLCYWLASTEILTRLFTLLFFYTSFGFMFVSTMEMLKRGNDFRHFRVWSQLFLCYSSNPADLGGGMFNSGQAEQRFLNGGVGVYIRFFAALLFYIMSYPLINPTWVPHAEVTVIATIMSVITLFSFMESPRRPDVLMLLSFALNVLARYPYDFDAVVQGWQFLDLRAPAFASAIVGRGIEFCLTYKSLLHISVALILVRMGYRNGWSGIYKDLVPHFVALAWWQIAVFSAESATKFDLLRAAFSIVGLGFCIPLIGVLLLLLPALAVLKAFASASLAMKAAYATAVAFLPFALSWWISRMHRRGTVHGSRLVLALQVICGMVAVAVLLFSFKGDSLSQTMFMPDETLPSAKSQGTDSMPQPTDTGLTWDVYHSHCHQPAWEKSSVALTQVSCSVLAGQRVSWNGFVTSVEVSRSSNPLSSLLQMLPPLISSPLVCLMGEQVPLVCPQENSVEAARCEILQASGQKCQLDAWTDTEVMLMAKMKSKRMWGTDAEVGVLADDFFKNFTSALRPTDRVWFQGVLLAEGLGGPRPRVRLEQIDCLDCHRSDLMLTRKPGRLLAFLSSSVDVIQVALQSFIGFVLGPMVRFT